MKMNKLEKVFSFETDLTFKKADPEDDNSPLIIEGKASTDDLDRMNDIIDPKAWSKGAALSAYKANPIVLAYHRHDKPIGKATEVRATKNGLELKATISKAANEVYSLIQEGILKAFSVGFIAKDMNYDSDNDYYNIKEVELVEVSVVSVPANPYATFSVSKCFDNSNELENFKKSLVESDEDNPENIEEINVMKKGEINTEATPNIDLDSIKAEMTKSVLEAIEAREAAKAEEERKQQEYDIQVKTAAERLLEDAKADIEKVFEEKTEQSVKEVQEKYKNDLVEAQEEIANMRAAMTANKMHYSKGGSDNLTEDEKDNAVLISKIMGKNIDGTKYFKDLVQKSGREHWESGTLDGWEETFSTRVHNEMREQLVVESIFTSMPMSTPTMHIPVNPEAGYGEWIPESSYRSSLPFGQETPGSGEVSSTGDAVNHQLKENSITAYKLATKEFLGYEEEEDSIIALLPIVRDAMARRMAKTSDRAILRGDGTTDLVTGLTNLGSSVTDVSFSLSSPAKAVSDVVYDDFITARKNLGQYGDDPSSCVWIVSAELYYHLLSTTFQDQFLTMDKIGSNATVLDGQIGQIAGTPVLLSRHFDNANISTPAAGTAFGVLVRPNNFIKGELRGMMVESAVDVFNQKKGYVASRRFGFKDLDAGYGVVKMQFVS